MKPFLIALAVMLFWLPCFPQFHYFFNSSNTNPPKTIAAHHIKRDSIFSYTLQGKKIIDSSFLAAEEYNTNGTIAAQTREIKGKKVQWTTVDSFFYNANGLLVKQTMGDQDGKPFSIYSIYYDSKGLDTGSYSYTNPSVKGARNSTCRKEFNNAGQLTKKYLQWDYEKMYLAEQYTYDKEGRVTEVNEYKEDGTILYTTLYEYKNDNRRKVAYHKTPDGPKKSMVYYYNRQGQCTRIEWGFSKDSWVYQFYYNPNGTLFEYKSVQGKKEELHRHYYSNN